MGVWVCGWVCVLQLRYPASIPTAWNFNDMDPSGFVCVCVLPVLLLGEHRDDRRLQDCDFHQSAVLLHWLPGVIGHHQQLHRESTSQHESTCTLSNDSLNQDSIEKDTRLNEPGEKSSSLQTDFQ